MQILGHLTITELSTTVTAFFSGLVVGAVLAASAVAVLRFVRN